GRLLASALDYDATLSRVAELAAHSAADFCIIAVVEGEEVRRQQVAHADPERLGLTRELLRFPLDRWPPHLPVQAREGWRSMRVPEMSDAVPEATPRGEEHVRILKALGCRSLMAVPLLARGRLLGTVLFVSARRSYDEGDLVVAERLAHLAALEMDNARLYAEARQAILARDRVLAIVAHDLRDPLSTISMSAELLLDESFPESQRKLHAQVIRRSAKRMNRLIEDLLDVVRTEADRLTL